MVDPGDSSVRGGVRRGSSGKAEAGEVEKPAGGGESVNWFPGHMVRALKDIRSKMKVVDIVVDVRDARGTCGNDALKGEISHRKRSDLQFRSLRERLDSWM